MKKALLALGVAALLAAPAHADITHKISSSVSLSVDGAGSVTLLVLTALPLLVMLFRTAKVIRAEIIRHQSCQQQSLEE